MSTGQRAPRGYYVDLIRDGVPADELRKLGDRAVFRALLRTAASFRQRGYSYADWAGLVSEARSNLGHQARVRRNKERKPRDYERVLAEAWDKAGKWLDEEAEPMFTAADVRQRVADLRAILGDADIEIPDTDRAVLAHACDVAERYGTTRPVMPWREVAAGTGLGERATKNALARLDREGVLRVEHPGRSGAGERRRQARLVHLPRPEDLTTTYLCRGTRPVGPPGLTYGTPTNSTAGTPGLTYGTPMEVLRSHHDDDKEEPMVSLTLKAADGAALREALDALMRDGRVSVAAADSDDDGGGVVVPLRRSTAR